MDQPSYYITELTDNNEIYPAFFSVRSVVSREDLFYLGY
jgi:hypothetical protein